MKKLQIALYLALGATVSAAAFVGGALIFRQVPVDPQIAGGALVSRQAPVGPVIDLEGWPSLGDPNAPVLMVEYSDFACFFCKRLHDEIMPQIKEQYINTGLVRFVYKNFLGAGGYSAAEASHCAAEQGWEAYWKYHNLLFERQIADRALWSEASTHRQYAKELGLDADALVTCFEERRYQDKVAASHQEALRNGGQGTPFVLINGTPIRGALPFAEFQAVIDAALR